ncbi:MAG: phosphatase PAP2 family protein [Planctomycetota bacterium]
MSISGHERIWTFYLCSVLAIDGLFGADAHGGRPLLHALTHLLLLVIVWSVPFLVRSPAKLAITRGILTTVGLVFVFSSLAWILPSIHPEPFEHRWVDVDRAWFGVDPTVWAQRLLLPPLVEVLQFCYAIFYFVPMIAVATIGVGRGWSAYQRALETILLGFTVSYLGYLWWPTLPPYRLLEHSIPIRGVWLAETLHEALDRAEVHRWNCFPSGHTMLSVLSLTMLWRHQRRAFWLLLPGVVLLVASTVVLRYHYVVDVLAGLVGVVLTLLLARHVVSVNDPTNTAKHVTPDGIASHPRSSAADLC